MMKAIKVLLIVPPQRFDFYNYLSGAEGVEWHLLWHENERQMLLEPTTLPLSFEKIYYWNEFKSPRHLLNTIQPQRIVFFEIIDLRQIALIITANRLKLPTYFLDHGAAGDKETAIQRWKEVTVKNKFAYLLNRFRTSFKDIILAKLYYYSVSKGFGSFSSFVKYWLLPVKMLNGAPNKVLSNNIFKERLPGRSLIFSKVNLDEFSIYTEVPESSVIITGIPYFDPYHRVEAQDKSHIVYIDHPYVEENIMSWTAQHHRDVADSLNKLAKDRQLQLYIKLHPRSDRQLWESYNLDPAHITIIQHGDFTKLYVESALILGFSSSLITGFLCARKNVVLLGWHPEPQVFGSDFSKTGLCHLSLDLKDLNSKWQYWLDHNLAKENEKAYSAFLQAYNFPFDGKATRRVIDAIVSGYQNEQ